MTDTKPPALTPDEERRMRDVVARGEHEPTWTPFGQRRLAALLAALDEARAERDAAKRGQQDAELHAQRLRDHYESVKDHERRLTERTIPALDRALATERTAREAAEPARGGAK